MHTHRELSLCITMIGIVPFPRSRAGTRETNAARAAPRFAVRAASDRRAVFNAPIWARSGSPCRAAEGRRGAEHPTRASRSIASLSLLYAYAPILKAGILEGFNDFPSIVALAQFLVVDEVVPAPMLPLAHIAVTVQVRVDAMHERKAAEERIAAPNLGGLLADRLCKAVKALRRTHDNAPVLPVLGNDFQHLRREIFGLVRREPILHLVDAGYHALYAVLIADQQPPIVELRALALQGEIGDALCPRVLFPPAKRLFGHSYRFTVALPTGKDNATLITEKLRVTSEIIRNHLFWQVVEEILPKGDFRNVNMLALFQPRAFPVGHDAIDRAAQTEQDEHGSDSSERPFDDGKERFEDIENNLHSSTPLHDRQRSPKGM